MVILSKHDKVDVGTSSARQLYALLRGGGTQVGFGSRGNTTRPNGSDNLQATPAVPLTTMFTPLNIVRVTATEASTAPQRTSASSVIQPSGGVISDIPNQSGFDPSTFDPTNSTLYEVVRIFRTVTPGMHFEAMTRILLKYSLSLHGFPPCPKEDLMLAVYFYLEEKFGIQAKMIACCHYEEYRHRREAEEQVGVLFDRIQTAEYILRRASFVQGSGIKVKPNKSYEWIMVTTARLAE